MSGATLALTLALGMSVAPLAAALPGGALPYGPVVVRLVDGRTISARRIERVGDRLVLHLGAATLRLRADDVVSVGSSAPGAAQAGALNLPQQEPAGVVPREDLAGEVEDEGAARLRSRPALPTGGLSEDKLRAALVADPSDAFARVALGRLLLEAGRLTDAVQELRRVPPAGGVELRRQAALCLADALTRLDRADEALAALDAVPVNAEVIAARAAIARDAEMASTDASSTHFIVRAPGDADRTALSALLDELEVVHEEIRSELGSTRVERLVVLLYPGDEFWEATGQERRVGGLYDGKVRVPAGRIDPPSPRLRELLRHEVAHAFVDELSAGRANAAWHEGIAEHFEGDDISVAEKKLRDVARGPGTWPPPATHENAHARMEWILRRFGMPAVARILAAMPAQGVDGATRAVIGLDSRELDEAWRRDLAAVAGH